MSFRLLAAAGGCLALGACMTPPPQAGSLDAGFGETTKYNAAVQVIDPDPVYPANGAKPGDSGVKAADASKRYRTDAVKEPKPAATSKNTTGSGGGSGPR